MLTNEIIHVGVRNKSQAISYISTKLLFMRLTNVTHVEIITGPNVSREELIESILTDEKFKNLVEKVENHAATIYVILK